MAKFMGREIPHITMKLKDIVIIPDYHKHTCIGKADYEFVAVTAIDGKRRRDVTLVRCKTCGKVFHTSSFYGRYVRIDNTTTPEKRAQKKLQESPVQRKSLPKDTKIYCYRKNKHECTGEPEYDEISASLFRGKWFRHMYYCKTCSKYFYSGEMGKMLDLNKANGWYYDLYGLRGRTEPPEELKPVKKAEETKEEKEGTQRYSTISPQDFVVVTSVKRCAVKGHDLQDIDASVRVLTKKGKIVQIITPAIYCRSCKQYYMLEQDYERVLEYGTPICRTITIDTYILMKEGKLKYNDESLLHSLGYNANAQEGLTDRERQNVLSVVIDEGAMSKAEVLSFLDYLIRRSMGSPRLDNARDKWTRDRQFVSQYKRRPAQNVDVQSITIRNYRMK